LEKCIFSDQFPEEMKLIDNDRVVRLHVLVLPEKLFSPSSDFS